MARNETLTSALTGIGFFLLGVLLTFLLMTFARKVSAETIIKDGWFVDSSAFLLLDRQFDAYSTFCLNGRNDDMTSDLGIDTTVFKYGVIEWHARLIHHSCSFGPDAPTYEALGTGIVIRFTR